MNQASVGYKVFIAGVIAAGLAALALTTPGGGLTGTLESPMGLALWLALFALAALSPLPRPRGRGEISLLPALDLAALLAFGVGAASWLAVFGRLVGNTAGRWNPLPRALLRLGRAGLVIGVAGGVHRGLGGQVGSDLFSDSAQMLAVGGAATVYIGLELLVRMADRAITRDGGAGFLALGEPAALAASVLPLGLVLAEAQVRLGLEATALFLVPLCFARYLAMFWGSWKRSHIETVRTLMAAVDASDPNTRGHSYRIAKMAVAVGRRLGMSPGEIERLEYAALLHDIGRTAVRQDLLMKAGDLTVEEYTEVRAHPRIGADFLKQFGTFEDAADIVLAHHEQPDGKGYPRGLGGRTIPLGSRIIMVVAAFDAMTSDRPYRRGLPPEEAFEELLENSGTQFFAPVVQALVDLYSRGRLFEEFAPEELERYATGGGSSRALAAYLGARGAKTGDSPASRRSTPAEDLPFIELHASQEVEEETFPVPGSGSTLRVAAGTDVGCIRSNNEDAYAMDARPKPGRGVLLILADGMGGEAAGEVASALAVETVCEAYFEGHPEVDSREALRRALDLANQAILTKASSGEEFQGMGTTCTAAVVSGDRVDVAHIGDSRAYLVADGEITLLTHDHTLAAELADLVGSVGGGLSLAPRGAGNVLTRCLGNQTDIDIEMSPESIPLRRDDAIVLCSDGLSNLVPPDEILETVLDADPGEACRRLIARAKERGAPDNVTVQVARLAA